MSEDIIATPVMQVVPALVTRPDGYFMPPAAGASTISFGATPGPDGAALVCIGVQHSDGEVLIAAIPECFIEQAAEAFLDATTQAAERRYAKPTGTAQ